jgi:hypothetical protein
MAAKTKKTRKKKATPDGAEPIVLPPPRTADLPGVEGPGVAPVSIPEIETLADEYVVARDRRMKLTEKEVDAKQKLSTALHKHADTIGKNEAGEIKYVYRGGEKDRRVITLKPSDEKLNVKDVEAFEE